MPSGRLSRTSRNTVSHHRARLDDKAEPPAKRVKTKPMVSLSRLPMIDLTGIQSTPPHPTTSDRHKLNSSHTSQFDATNLNQLKGKNKEALVSVTDTRLWAERYGPTNEDELAVHKRKVQDVRHWLLEAFGNDSSSKLKKYRRILVLTGPAGTAKTATVRILSEELGYDILEWQNSMNEQFSCSESDWNGVEYEGLADKFRTFLTRASTCRPIFPSQNFHSQSSQDSRASQAAASSSSSSRFSSSRQRVILLEDLPNILHPATQASFHSALDHFVSAPDGGVSPLIVIISDVGLRGENGEEGGARWRQKEVVDVRNVLPPHLLNSPYVTQIRFNPIAATYMRAALKSMLDQHFSTPAAIGTRPTKDVLDLIVESSNGDIRSAINALQFACTGDHGAYKPAAKSSKKGKSKGPSAAVMLEAVTRREQSLALFHLLGKIMYNKRKGDPSAQSATAKEVRRDKDTDAGLKDPPSLPPHYKHHERRASRVDVETLYADTPIDASLLSLYIHQNYTQYCNTLDECEALMESLSWVDSSGGESWYQANPHQFHLVALGTMHALPAPVPRRNQKAYKPAFFETLKRQHEAEDGVRDVQLWLQRLGTQPVSSWGTKDIVLGVGSLWRASARAGAFVESIPSTYRSFAGLEFVQGRIGLDEIAHEDEPVPDEPTPQREDRPLAGADETISGDFLSDDDIEEW